MHIGFEWFLIVMILVFFFQFSFLEIIVIAMRIVTTLKFRNTSRYFLPYGIIADAPSLMQKKDDGTLVKKFVALSKFLNLVSWKVL